ncbi:MAG: hypothetical protein AAF968_00030 [Pseudomonadota bacterium]
MTFVVRIPFIEFEALVWPQGDAPTRLESATLSYLLAFEDVGRSLEEITDFLCVGRPATLELVAGLWRRDWVTIDLRTGTIWLRPTVANEAKAPGRAKAARFAHLGTAEKPERIDLAYDLLTGQVVPGLRERAVGAGDDRDTCGPKPGNAGPFDQPLDGWTDLAPETISAALRDHPRYRQLETMGREPPVVDLPPPRASLRRDAVRYARIRFRAQRELDGSIRLTPSNSSGIGRVPPLARALDRIGPKIADYLLAEEVLGPAAKGGPMRQRLEDAAKSVVAGAAAPASARLRLRLEVEKIVEAAKNNDLVAQSDAERCARALLPELDNELRNRMRFSPKKIEALPKRAKIDEAMRRLICTPPRNGCADPRFLITAPSIAAGADLAKWDAAFQDFIRLQEQAGEDGASHLHARTRQRLLAIRWRPARPADADRTRRGLAGFVRKEDDLKDAQAAGDPSVRDVSIVACDGNQLIISNVSPFSQEREEGCGVSVVFEGGRALAQLEQRFVRGFEDASKAADLRAAVGGEGRFLVEPPEHDESPPAPPGGWPQPLKDYDDDDVDVDVDDEDDSAVARRLRAEDWRGFPQSLDDWIAKRPSVELLFDDEIHDEAVAMIATAPVEEPVAVVLSDAVHGVTAELFDALAECAKKRPAGQMHVWLPSVVSDGMVAEFGDRLNGASVARLPDRGASTPIAVIARGAALFAVDGVARRRTGFKARRGLVRLGLALRGPSVRNVAEALKSILPATLQFDVRAPTAAASVGDLSGRLAKWRDSFKSRPLGLGLDVIEELDAKHVGALERLESVAGADLDADFRRAAAKFRAQKALKKDNIEAARIALLADGAPEGLFVDALFCEPSSDAGASFRRELLFAATAGVPVRVDSLPTDLAKLIADRETAAALALALMRPEAGALAYAVTAWSLAEEEGPAVELIEALTERAMLPSPPSFRLAVEASADSTTADEIAEELRGSLASHRTVDRANKETNRVKAILYEKVEDKRDVLGQIEAALNSGGSEKVSRVEAALRGASEAKGRDVGAIKNWRPTAQRLLTAAVKVNQDRNPTDDDVIGRRREWLIGAISNDLTLAAKWVGAVRRESAVDPEAAAATARVGKAAAAWRSEPGEKPGRVETALHLALERAASGDEPVEAQLWRYPAMMTMHEVVKERNWSAMRDAVLAEEWTGAAETAAGYFDELLAFDRFEEADALLTCWPVPLDDDDAGEMRRRLDDRVGKALDDLATHARTVILRKTLLGLIASDVDHACREVIAASSDPAPAQPARASAALRAAEENMEKRALALVGELRERAASHEKEATRVRADRLLLHDEIGTAQAVLLGRLGAADGDSLPPILNDAAERALRALNRHGDASQLNEGLPAARVAALKALLSLAQTDGAADESVAERAIVALSAALSTTPVGGELVELDDADGDALRFRCISGGLVAATPPVLAQDNGVVFVTVPRSKEAQARAVDNGQWDDLFVAPRRIAGSLERPHLDIDDLFAILAQNAPQARADAFAARVAAQAGAASAICWPGTDDASRAAALASFTGVEAADFTAPQSPEAIQHFVRRLRLRLGIRFSGDRKRDEVEVRAVEDIIAHWAGGLRLNAAEILLRANRHGVIAAPTLGSRLRRRETWRPLARRALELAGLPLELGQELIEAFILFGEDLRIDPDTLSREFGDTAGLSIEGLVERSGLVSETEGGITLVDAAFLSMLEAGEV